MNHLKGGLPNVNRKDFEALVVPLSEKEKRHRDDPKAAGQWYQKEMRLSKEPDGVYRFDGVTDLTRIEHGVILSGGNQLSPYQNIVFNKQTRYSQVPLHRHSYLEMFYIYAGHCTATINGRRVALDAGDVCIMDTQAIHAIDPTGEEDIVLNCLMDQKYFNAQFIGRLASSGMVAQFLADALNGNNKHDQYLLFHTAEAPIVHELFENAFCEYLDPGVCSEDMLDGYMTLIFIQLARCYQSAKEAEYRRESRRYITEVLRYIEQNYASCTLEETAARFSFHPNYLSRALKKATGFSFKELVDQNRLRQAAFLLRSSALSIAEVALRCGWSNLNQFYRKFEAGYGVTPRQYRDGAE